MQLTRGLLPSVEVPDYRCQGWWSFVAVPTSDNSVDKVLYTAQVEITDET